MEKEEEGEEGEVRKTSNITEKEKKNIHNCNLENKDGTRKLIGRN